MDFSGGLASVLQNGKWGFIDKNGKVVIPLIYEEALYFEEGLGSVKQNGKYGFVDRNGTIVIPTVYDKFEPFSEGLVAVSKDGKYGYLDKNGKAVVPLIFEDASTFRNGTAQIKINGKWGIFEKPAAKKIKVKNIHRAEKRKVRFLGLFSNFNFLEYTSIIRLYPSPTAQPQSSPDFVSGKINRFFK